MTPAELTEAREDLHFSQVELSRLLGIHPTMLNRWEHGRAKIPPYLHLALKWLGAECEICHRPGDELVDGRFQGQRICPDCRAFQDQRAAGTDFLSKLSP